MSNDKTVRVYLITGEAADKPTKNYIKSVRNKQMLFGSKAEARHFSPKQANILQRILIDNFGNGHIESD